MPVESRRDAENLAILEKRRPQFEALKAERIRSESDVERFQKELDAAMAEAEAELGTSDLGEIRRMIEDGRAANTEAVDAFVAALDEIKRAGDALAGR